MSQANRFIEFRGTEIPAFLYGTAWKEERTETLTQLALESGFTGIDTANQRKHYHEVAVGNAVKQALDSGLIKREKLFLQTKFTFLAGQDHRLPYDPKADYTTQVNQSFASSLEHLHTTYLDSYVLHGPSTRQGLGQADWEVWRAMEALQKSGATKFLGVSNISASQLQLLIDKAEIKPAFVQNRCYAQMKWDNQVRDLCYVHNMIYQGFSLLTANSRELNHPEIQKISKRLNCAWTQVVFAFALHVGMQPLTGTSNPQHMQEDLEVVSFSLTEEEVSIIENIAV